MDTAFGWLGQIMEFVGSLFPRLVIVTSTHGGVCFVRGKHPREIKPGLVWYWPIWTEVMTYPVVRQSLNLPSQTLTTSDKRAVSISVVIIFRISNVLDALTLQWDLSETTNDIAMAAVREFVFSRTFDEMLETGKRADKRLKRLIADPLSVYGVEVMDAWITDLAATKVITLVRPDQSGGLEADE